MTATISSLFSPEPDQWGLRGDPYLWQELAEYFGGVPLPGASRELAAALERAFLELTGHPVSYSKHFRIEKHAHGGMSSGGISTEFWRESGIPLLLSRFIAQQGTQADGPRSPQLS